MMPSPLLKLKCMTWNMQNLNFSNFEVCQLSGNVFLGFVLSPGDIYISDKIPASFIESSCN